MRLALHIFKKDGRRLWREIAVTLVLLGAVTRLDRQRADAVPGLVEGWLNLLLPVAWAYLLAMLIHQEPLVGDRQFWITRPYPRPALVAAKALFALVYIHLPSLVADGAIVAARGFSPWHSAGAVMWKQVLLVAAVTLPVAALSAVTRNLAQFAIVTVASAGVGLLVLSGVHPFPRSWMVRTDQVETGIPWLVMTLAGITIVWVQYASRRTAASRIVAVVAVALAAAVFLYLPPDVAFQIQCQLSGTRREGQAVSIALGKDAGLREQGRQIYFPGRDKQVVAIPFQVVALKPEAGVQLRLLGLEIIGRNGERWRADLRPKKRTLPQASVRMVDRESGWVHLSLDRSVLERFKDTKVEVTGNLAVIVYRERESLRAPALFPARAAPGVGRCFSTMSEEFGREMLKVTCESASDLPLFTRVSMVHPPSAREWRHRLADSTTFYDRPVVTWLSPLHRAQTVFHAVEKPEGPGSQWQVPRDALTQAEIAVVAAWQTECMNLRYELRDLRLQEFVVEPIRP